VDRRSTHHTALGAVAVAAGTGYTEVADSCSSGCTALDRGPRAFDRSSLCRREGARLGGDDGELRGSWGDDG
jgi:hypothetical protein